MKKDIWINLLKKTSHSVCLICLLNTSLGVLARLDQSQQHQHVPPLLKAHPPLDRNKKLVGSPAILSYICLPCPTSHAPKLLLKSLIPLLLLLLRRQIHFMAIIFLGSLPMPNDYFDCWVILLFSLLTFISFSSTLQLRVALRETLRKKTNDVKGLSPSPFSGIFC